MNILDKYAVVTWASSGIGWRISKELAARGYSIVAVSNQSENITKLKSELQETYGNTIYTIDCDLSTYGGKAERVPGLINKFILLFIPLIPHTLIGYIYKKRAGRKGK